METCNHEETDSRLLVHVRDAVNRGAKNVMIRTVDTDVVVIAVSDLSKLQELEPDVHIWIAFDMGKNFQYFSVHAIHESLGRARQGHYQCSTHFQDATQHLHS